MSDFKYPDENDVLTAALIEEQFDGEYWGKSEDCVLMRAEEYLLKRYGEERLSTMTLLDLGCGMGRLIPRFARLFGRVVGLEPDADRCAGAEELIRQQRISNAVAVNTDCTAYLHDNPGARFDVVLCSHIFQHISHELFIQILRDLESCTGADADFIFTTTYIHREENEYSKEYFEDGRRQMRVIDYAEFLNVMGKPGILPVCRFSRSWMEKLLAGFGYETELFAAYHFADAHDSERDEDRNKNPEELRKARDAFYICRKARTEQNDDSVAGKICYMQFFNLEGKKPDLSILNAVREDEQAKTIRADFDTAEGFLYGGGLHFPAKRHFFTNVNLHLDRVAISDSHVVISVYPDVNVCQISVCLRVEEASTENFVYLHQLQGSPAENFETDGRRVSIPGLCEEFLKRFGLKARKGATGCMMELNRFCARADAETLTEEEMKRLYGMLTGDEGWRHVPVELARERMNEGWTSRDFVKAVVFNNSYLLLNLNCESAHRDYLAGQYGYQYRYYNGMNEYFTMDADTAGVNHGFFFSAETGLVVKTVVDRQLEDRPNLERAHGVMLGNEIKENKRRRIGMIGMLNKVETVSISELGELDALVLRQLNTSERVESIRSLLELLESDLDLLYSTNTNYMVTLLTLLGLVFALIQIVIGVIPLF